ncbi:MAG: 3'-5' exonuclease [Bdellovibrionaceae bacterium]|nr:3'-5' exonuclease [Pseudobdellovibrionaceae bacterium]
MRFVAFDLETTGTVPGVDQIVEIGAVKYLNGEPEGTFSTLINPRRSIPPQASAVNGITDDMLVGQPFIEDLLESFAEFCGDIPLVAHNAPFDAQFLTADIKRFESSAPKGVILDTLPISRKVFPGLANYKLGTLVDHLKIQSGVFHRAEEDASYCGQLLVHIIKKVFQPGEEIRLENLIALTGKPEYRFPQVVKQPKQISLFDL